MGGGTTLGTRRPVGLSYFSSEPSFGESSGFVTLSRARVQSFRVGTGISSPFGVVCVFSLMTKPYPPDHPLRSAQLKARRAKMHINALDRSIRRTTPLPNVSIAQKGRLEPRVNLQGVLVEGADVEVYDFRAPVRDAWGLIVGDIVANLRQSLDHVAWALALEKVKPDLLPERDASRIQFPIFDDEKRFTNERSTAERTRPYIDQSAWNLIRDCQPHPANLKKRPKLWMLGAINELGNRDKHRLVTPIANLADVRYPGEPQGPMTIRFNQQTEHHILIPDSIRSRLGNDLQPEATFDIGIPCTFTPPDEVLFSFSVARFVEIHQFILNEVIPSFAGFFS